MTTEKIQKFDDVMEDILYVTLTSITAELEVYYKGCFYNWFDFWLKKKFWGEEKNTSSNHASLRSSFLCVLLVLRVCWVSGLGCY